MRILMTASDTRAEQEVRTVLEGTGHEVLSCTDGSDGPFPCRGVAGETCPLDEGVAVAVSAPGSVAPEPRAGDVGLICALRHHLPVLVATEDVAWSASRFTHVATADLPAAVEAAATAPLRRHTEVVVAEARRIVDGADATVVRVDGGLRIEIDLPEPVSTRLAEVVAVKAQGAVRRMDPWAKVVDVRVDTG